MLCSRCLMPDTRPRVQFTDGVCNACLYNDSLKEVDWHAREKEFLEIVELESRVWPVHRTAPRGEYDCVVPFSGGKDSATVAWRLRDFGLRPLLVTYGQLLWTELGRRNFERVCRAGFDILYWRHDQDVSRRLARRFLVERGHPKQHYDSGVNAVPVRTAKAFGIPLIFYAEHGESEYGGHVLSEEHRRTRDLQEVLENQVGDDARNWAVDGIEEKQLTPYIYPEDVSGITAYYFSYFFPWDIYGNAIFVRDQLGFEQAHNGHRMHPTLGDPLETKLSMPPWWGKSDGSFEGFDSIDDMIDDLDFYMMYIKFGFGRATRMASRLIQKGHMTREQGLELVKRYDGEFPSSYLDDVLEYLDMDLRQLHAVIDRHRNPEIWKQENGAWLLRNSPN